MEIYVSDGIAQPYLMMLFRGISDGENSKPDAAALEKVAGRLISIVEETVNKLTDEGFAKRDLEASLNQTDFRFRQYPEPQALYRQRQYDLLADAVRESLDLDAIYRAMEDYDT